MQMVAEAADAVELILTDGTQKAMARYNGRAAADEESSEQ
jgi:hypothetical protein